MSSDGNGVCQSGSFNSFEVSDARQSTPYIQQLIALQAASSADREDDVSLSKDMAELEGILEGDNDENRDAFENAAIYEFMLSKRKSKYLFDGVNMIKIKPLRNAALKALMGKAFYMQKKLRSKLANNKTTCNLVGSRTTVGPANVPMGVLSDYVSDTSPRVPPLVLYCVSEIENRLSCGCAEEGIYRVSGSDEEVKMLKRIFLTTDEVPDLVKYDIHTVTGCVKNFFRTLQDTVIPNCMWSDFVDASKVPCDQQKMEQMKELVMRLPDANRETLAYFVPHLQRISAYPQAKMPLISLAKVFAPTLIGFSSNELGIELSEAMIIIGAMHAVLEIPFQFWNEITGDGCTWMLDIQ